MWFLPTWLPAGWEVLDIRSRVDAPPAVTPPQRRIERWVSRQADGRSIANYIEISAAPTESPRIPKSTAKVHGIPAFVSSGGDSVSWPESGFVLTVNAPGTTAQRTIALADASSLDIRAGRAHLDPTHMPTGYMLVPGDAFAPLDPLNFVFVTMGPASPSGSWADLSVDDARVGGNLDQVVTSETKRVILGGIERSIVIEPPDKDGPFTAVRWFSDGLFVTMTAHSDDATAERLAVGITRTTLDAARASAAAITDGTLTIPPLGSVTFKDGAAVTLRARGGVPAGLCRTAAARTDCHRDVSFHALTGGTDDQIFDEFVVGDHLEIIGWQRTKPNYTTSTGDPVEAVESGGGWFIRVALAPGQTAPDLLVNGAPTVHLSGAMPP
jgi:hypothetical protein